MGVLGPDYPRESDARHDILDELEPDEELDALDRRFFDLEATTSADAVLSAYLAQTS
jgi:hypothetical protein